MGDFKQHMVTIASHSGEAMSAKRADRIWLLLEIWGERDSFLAFSGFQRLPSPLTHASAHHPKLYFHLLVSLHLHLQHPQKDTGLTYISQNSPSTS